MNSRATPVLVLIAVALFAAIWLIERRYPGTREEGRREQYVVAFDREKIDGITITRGEEVVELRKQSGHWEIARPLTDQADRGMIDRLLTETEFLRRADAVAGRDGDWKKRLKEFGLNRPKLRLKLHGDQAPPELLFGKDTAVTGMVYARLEDGRTAYAVPDTLKQELLRKADDFRSRKLTDLDIATVEGVAIKTARGELELRRDDQEWHLIKPVRARADEARVRDFVVRAALMPIAEFSGAANSPPADAGFGEPRATIRLAVAGQAEPTVVEIGAPVAAAAAAEPRGYVRCSGRNGVYAVPAGVLDELLKLAPNDLRDRRFVRLEFDMVDRVRIAAAGRPEILLARDRENWRIKSWGDRPADAAAVKRLAETLRALQVDAFVADVATAAANYGLEPPQLTLTFSSFASENTPETTAGERPFLTLQFGRREGAAVYARIADEPFIVAVPASFLDQVPGSPVVWQAPMIFNLDPAQINFLETVGPALPTFQFTRQANGDWTLSQGAGAPDPVAVASLVNSLATLRAYRWVGEPAPEHGLTPPAKTLRFRAADGAEHLLAIGAAGPERMLYAQADGAAGVFLISAPDASALAAQLVRAPGPSPTPTPAAIPATPKPQPPAAPNS